MSILSFKKGRMNWLFAVALGLVVWTGQNSAQAQQAVKEWTFLVYMNADNNLYQYGFLNMNQMEKIGSTDMVNVVVQMDHENRSIPTTRYYVTQHPNNPVGKIGSQALETLGETDMGNPQTLADFLSWGIQKYPARHYAVIIWNHGNGWEGVSYDDNPRNALSMPDVRMAMEKALTLVAGQRRTGSMQNAKFDIINFDACIMSTLEVAYELKDVGQYVVGSQFNEPGEGEDYTKFLGPLVARPQMTARELAETMVYQYALTYKGRASINYAAIDLSRVPAFTGIVNNTSKAMAASPAREHFRRSFGSGSFDLVGAFTRAQTISTSQNDPQAQAVLDQLIAAYGYPQDFQQNNKQRGFSPTQKINRTFPGTVYYRMSAQNGSWLKVELQPSQAGVFSADIPSQAVQYTVQRAPSRLGFAGPQQTNESLTTILRQGNDPIVFHNKFPETSPLVADAYTFSTPGAHGMTMYSLAGVAANLQPQTRNIGGSILQQYKKLLFATLGAPAWTAFFGF